MDISGLARAAVAGDEQALDLFTSGQLLFLHLDIFSKTKMSNNVSVFF